MTYPHSGEVMSLPPDPPHYYYDGEYFYLTTINQGGGGPRTPYHPHPNLPPQRGKEAQGLSTLSQKELRLKARGFHHPRRGH
jgi:hypothetical protein